MTDTGYKASGTQTNTGAGHTGTNPTIANLGNVVSSDNSYATISHGSGINTSDYMHFTNFDMSSIPSGSTINGIDVNIERKQGTANRGSDGVVQLVIGGSHVGTNKASATKWPTSDAVASYGGTADLWGNTITYTDVVTNQSTFGVALKTTNNGNGTTVMSVDYIELRVTYTAPAGSVGSATGVATAAAVGASAATAAGSSTGVGAATGVGASNAQATASSTGAATAQAVGVGFAVGVGSSTGAATAQATGASAAKSTAFSTGVGAATGTGASNAQSTASSTGTGAATGVGRSNAASTAASTGTGAATGIGAAKAAAVGSSSGVGAAQGIGSSIAASIAYAAGVATAAAVGTTAAVIVAVDYVVKFRRRRRMR